MSDEPRLLGFPTPGRVTADEIERARAAIENAPTTEAGIVIPPQVAADIAREKQADAAPKANRAQRRAAARRARQTARHAVRHRYNGGGGDLAA